MVVVMQERATEAQIQSVIAQLVEMGFDVHRSTGVVADGASARSASGIGDPQLLAVQEGVHEVLRITRALQAGEPDLQAGEHGRRRSATSASAATKSSSWPGPCSAETEEQVEATAAAVKRAGAKILRGGAFKPRSSPYSFQGLGEAGLKMLRAAADRHDLKLITEVMEIGQIELIERYADILQVGARNMQNYLAAARARPVASKPVLLKRGISATIEEWLLSAEYVLAGGNKNVMLCERGIRTFESYTRNTLDISAIPVVQKLSHLPIIVDPSHGTGRRDKVAPMARAAVAAGADGLHHRGALRSRPRAVRRRAVAVPGAVRAADGRAARHRAGDRPQHLRRAGRPARLEPLSRHGAAAHARRRRRRSVGIAGLGLIGGSIALGVRARLAGRAADGRRSAGRAASARRRRSVIDAGARRGGDLSELRSDRARRAGARRSSRCSTKPRAPASTRVVTDVGSTKRQIIDGRAEPPACRRSSAGIRWRAPNGVAWQHARADLFAGRPWVIVDGERTATAVAVVESLAAALGADAARDRRGRARSRDGLCQSPAAAGGRCADVGGGQRMRAQPDSALAGRGVQRDDARGRQSAGHLAGNLRHQRRLRGEALARACCAELPEAALRSAIGDRIDRLFADAQRWRRELQRGPVAPRLIDHAHAAALDSVPRPRRSRRGSPRSAGCVGQPADHA